MIMSEPYSDLCTHEALHITYVLMDTFTTHVVDSRCVATFPDVKIAADKAHHALFELYQLLLSKSANS